MRSSRSRPAAFAARIYTSSVASSPQPDTRSCRATTVAARWRRSAGTMGLLLAQLAKDAGEGQIDIVDTNPGRHALATRFGADHVARSATELDRPQGWDVVIDATGVVPAIEDGLKRVSRGGTFLMFGV